MKIARSAFLAGILAIAGISAAAQSDAGKKIQAIYSKMDALALKKDMAGISKYLGEHSTEDCVFIPKTSPGVPARTVARDEVLSQLAGEMKMVESIDRSTSHVDKVRVSGGTATVVVSQVQSLRLKPMQDGKPHSIVQKTTSEDTWVLAGGVWKLSKSKMTALAISQDGKDLPTG